MAMNKTTKYFECACFDYYPLKISYFPKEDSWPSEIIIANVYKQGSFWYRVKNAFFYIFKSKHLTVAEFVILDKAVVNEIIEILKLKGNES